MTVSPFLDILQLTEAQSQKATAMNTAMEQLAQTLSDVQVLSVGDIPSLSTTLELPYDAGSDLSDRSGLRAIYYIIENDTYGFSSFSLEHPPVKHFFCVTNNSNYTCEVRVPLGASIVTIPAGQTAFCICLGEDGVVAMVPNIQSVLVPYDFDASFFEKPIASQIIARWLVGRNVELPANMALSRGHTVVNPTSAVTMNLRDDGVTIGTISVSTSGVFTFTTTSGTAKSIAGGSILDIEFQGTADATFENFMIVLRTTYEMAQ